LTREIARQLGSRSTSGVVVVDVVRGSSADDGGLEVGDIILAVDNSMVASTADLDRAFRRSGGEAELRVVRDGLRGTLTIRP
ncbi:MAG: PDZ domain-containing protein, partial [Planctomycetota bacterium]